jgi:hypothetical protein
VWAKVDPRPKAPFREWGLRRIGKRCAAVARGVWHSPVGGQAPFRSVAPPAEPWRGWSSEKAARRANNLCVMIPKFLFDPCSAGITGACGPQRCNGSIYSGLNVDCFLRKRNNVVDLDSELVTFEQNRKKGDEYCQPYNQECSICDGTL